MNFQPWLIGIFAMYAIAITTIATYLLVAGDPARKPKPPIGQAPEFDHDGDILAVAEQGLAEAPELTDDAEAVARTILALDEVAELRRLARADGAEAAFVTPGTPRADALLAALFPRTKNAPKERP